MLLKDHWAATWQTDSAQIERRTQTMEDRTCFSASCLFLAIALFGTSVRSAETDIPAPLQPWVDWVTSDTPGYQCPTIYNLADQPICFWPSELQLKAKANRASWSIDVRVFQRCWIPLPGSDQNWPLNVQLNGDPIAVLQQNGRPALQLSPGVHELVGEFVWSEIPQRIAIPSEVGILSLELDGQPVALPNWDTSGNLWLKRQRAEVEDKDLVSIQVYRVLEDGIPIWLQTEIELTVSGKSREEDLGWILPKGWILTRLESPIPVAIDEDGQMRAQIRAGKWSIHVHAFRTDDPREIGYSATTQPITNSELVGFRAKPKFRLIELEGVRPIDATQTTFPAEWRNLPIYQWETSKPFRLIQKKRGMGKQMASGLNMKRHFWLDESGKGLTFHDQLHGTIQEIGRLDVVAGQDLGSVRVNGKAQLITTDPETDAQGVEVRVQDLHLEAIGRVERTDEFSATGWKREADSLNMTLTLPPGWQLLALFGADEVSGDWLTSWTLLDLFLLLIFSLAIFRLWGIRAGILAFLAFGLAYQEPGAPRLLWLFLLMPIALLRVVPSGSDRRWLIGWKYLAILCLVLCLIPFFAIQIQSVIYPQLELQNNGYAARSMLSRIGAVPFSSARYGRTLMPAENQIFDEAAKQIDSSNARFQSSNLLFDPQAKIQTGPGKPQWRWNQIEIRWNGPVSEKQKIHPILISLPIHRLLTVVRLVLLLSLGAIVLGVGPLFKKVSPRAAAAVITIALYLLPTSLQAQIPDQAMLQELRERLLKPSDAYPNTAEIPTVDLNLAANRVTVTSEIHTALQVAVPLPGRLPEWSPVSVKVANSPNAFVTRRDNYLWVVLPAGVHQVEMQAILPDTAEWEWTFLLQPKRVNITAPGWNISGLSANGVPEKQIFFSKQQVATSAAEASYDRRDFNSIVAVERQLEIGLIWQVHTQVTRLSKSDKALSLQIPLLPNESVLTANVNVVDSSVNVAIPMEQQSFKWTSELPVGQEISLTANKTSRWIERWSLVNSPVWNFTQIGLQPIYETSADNLIPTWHPWPNENVLLTFSRPSAVEGETVTIKQVEHQTSVGRRQRNTDLTIELESSLATEFKIGIDSRAKILAIVIDNRQIPIRFDEGQLSVPVGPGNQTIKISWSTPTKIETRIETERIALPLPASNVETSMDVPESRWILWATGPRRGPAVRFWSILVFAIVAALILAGLPLSPLHRLEWVLLAIGLTQVHLMVALSVIGWLFLLAWRGKQDPDKIHWAAFNLLQLLLIGTTVVAMVSLTIVVGQGLLGNPDMFIEGNASTRTHLVWFQPLTGQNLPQPFVISISVWFYRLAMLCWALWLASALLRWLRFAWTQFNHGARWRRKNPRHPTAPVQVEVVK